MSNITNINKYKKITGASSLVRLAQKYDDVSLEALGKGEALRDIAGIMANRLGELVRVSPDDKEALIELLLSIIQDRVYLGEKK